MKHLFLIRHAKSSWADEGLADRDRPLNTRGEQQLQPLGKAYSSWKCSSPATSLPVMQPGPGIPPRAFCQTCPKPVSYRPGPLYVRLQTSSGG